MLPHQEEILVSYINSIYYAAKTRNTNYHLVINNTSILQTNTLISLGLHFYNISRGCPMTVLGKISVSVYLIVSSVLHVWQISFSFFGIRYPCTTSSPITKGKMLNCVFDLFQFVVFQVTSFLFPNYHKLGFSKGVFPNVRMLSFVHFFRYCVCAWFASSSADCVQS